IDQHLHGGRPPGAGIVGWRTDNFNFASQRAIERLGAKKDGVIRGQALRRDGTIRDTVMYSLSACEWPEARAQLLDRLRHHDAAAQTAPGGSAC
ncbi:MAG: GNAT family N-acetyltransferase, partial [Hylemonella sp.]